MPSAPSAVRDRRVIAVLGGTVYAITALSWMYSQGVRLSSQDPLSVAFGLGYAATGLFLVAAFPLYLLDRFSLGSPLFATVWLLGDTIYRWWYGTHLTPCRRI